MSHSSLLDPPFIAELKSAENVESYAILFRGDASFNPHPAANATSAAIETLVFSIVFMTLVSFVYLSH